MKTDVTESHTFTEPYKLLQTHCALHEYGSKYSDNHYHDYLLVYRCTIN